MQNFQVNKSKARMNEGLKWTVKRNTKPQASPKCTQVIFQIKSDWKQHVVIRRGT